MFVLSQKLKLLKTKLKTWNEQTFGYVHVIVIDEEEKLQMIQDDIDLNGHSGSLMDQQQHAHIELQKALDREEVFWHEKSKVKWHLEGDRNTGFFP